MLVKSPSEMQHEMHAGSLIARCQSQVNNKTKTSPKKININNICKKKKSQEATICQRPGGADISFAACLPPPGPLVSPCMYTYTPNGRSAEISGVNHPL